MFKKLFLVFLIAISFLLGNTTFAQNMGSKQMEPVEIETEFNLGDGAKIHLKQQEEGRIAYMEAKRNTAVGILVVMFVICIGLFVFAFYLWMLIDCIRFEKSDTKMLWVIIIIFVGPLGALLYLFLAKLKRKKTKGKK